MNGLKNEIELAKKQEEKNAPDGEWDYGCACYDSAFKAFQSLCEDGHSGMSIGFTKNILNRLIDAASGFKREVVIGYKSVDRLKRKLAEHGAVFMKTEECFELPEQQEIMIRVASSKEYWKFMKNSVVIIKNKLVEDQVELVGDCVLTKLLYARQLCGIYQGLRNGIFPWGYAVKNQGSSVWTYFINSAKFAEHEGIQVSMGMRV